MIYILKKSSKSDSHRLKFLPPCSSPSTIKKMNNLTVTENSNFYTLDLNIFEDFLRDYIKENLLDSYDTWEDRAKIQAIHISFFFPVLKEIIDGLTEDLVINSDHYITSNGKEEIKRVIDKYLED